MKFEAATATQEVVEILCGVSPNTFILNVMAILLFIGHIYKCHSLFSHLIFTILQLD